MRKWLTRLGLDMAWFQQWTAFKTLAAWRHANPDWSLRAFVGLLLEETADGEARG
jgi:hypothetical protein